MTSLMPPWGGSLGGGHWPGPAGAGLVPGRGLEGSAGFSSPRFPPHLAAQVESVYSEVSHTRQSWAAPRRPRGAVSFGLRSRVWGHPLLHLFLLPLGKGAHPCRPASSKAFFLMNTNLAAKVRNSIFTGNVSVADSSSLRDR